MTCPKMQLRDTWGGPGSGGCWMPACQILVRPLIRKCCAYIACSCSNHTQNALHHSCYGMHETESEAFGNTVKSTIQAR